MKFLATSFLATALFVAKASAHSTVYGAKVGSGDLVNGEKVFIRSPPNNNPVKDLKSTDMICNVNGATAVPKTVTVAAGETLTLMWKHDNPNDDIIASSHKGPIIDYLAPISADITSASWVKIAEEGYSGGSWAVDKLIAASGAHTITIPKNLAPGEYLLREEIIALHEADTLHSQDSARGAQFYPDCTQITVTGSGSVTLPAGVAINEAYTDSTPGIKFSLYDGTDPSTYPIPGPVVWDGTTGGSAPAPATSSAAATSTSVAAPEPTTSSTEPEYTSTSVAAPEPTTSSTEPEYTSTSVAAPEPTTSATEPEPTTSAAEPEPTTSAAEPEYTSTSVAAPAPVSTTSAAPAPVPTPTGGVVDANTCWRTYNKCLDQSQPHLDFTGCSATRDSCMTNARYMRLRRSAKIGRAL